MNISDLPDSVLCHILSKLDTKSAVTTTLLSTRWKHLFSQIPNLQLFINDFHVSSHYFNFMTFMRTLLFVHLTNVTRISILSLDIKHVYPASEIEFWFSIFSIQNISEFWFSCREECVAEVSSGIIFHSDFLERLTLGFVRFVNNISYMVYLPNLKTLSLVYVTFSDGYSLERVISACPVLNSLSIRNCEIGGNLRFLRISSASVKEVDLCMLRYCFDDDKYILEFDMPVLESLRYKDHVPYRYHLKNLSSLSEAYIELGLSLEQLTGEEENIWRKFQEIELFVEACSLVSSLHLPNNTVGALSFLSAPLPTFHNLKELKLSEIGSSGWYLLPQFLESAPNLEVLVFDGGFPDLAGCFSNFRIQSNMLEHEPMCLAFHLQTIKFEKFKGEEDEMGLIEYFLKHAQVLRKIVLMFSSSVTTEKLRYTKSQLWALRNYSRKHQVDLEFDQEKISSLAMNESEEMNEE